MADCEDRPSLRPLIDQQRNIQKLFFEYPLTPAPSKSLIPQPVREMDQNGRTYSTIGTVNMGTAFLLNLIVTFPNLFHLHKLPPSSFLIVFLCLSDCLTSANVVAITTTHLIRKTPDYDIRLCQIQGALIIFSATLSMSICAGLTLFRYLVIVCSMNITKQFTVVYFIGAIFFSIAVSVLPFLLGSQIDSYVLQPTGVHCALAWNSREPRTLAVAIIFPIIILSALCGIIYAYIRIYLTVSSDVAALRSSGVASAKRFKSNSGNTGSHTASFTVEITQEEDKARFSLRRNNAAAVDPERAKQMSLLVQSIVVVGVFVLGWGPYFLFIMVELVLGPVSVSTDYEFASEFFVGFGEVLNPVAVLLFDVEIRKNVFAFFRCWMRHSS
ncbi:hypothetical protein HDU77_001741 [Chytriomyces hyalinus]|nr:hypothetical protein HDU77_001741 [Chytriomyces hyalinus]